MKHPWYRGITMQQAQQEQQEEAKEQQRKLREEQQQQQLQQQQLSAAADGVSPAQQSISGAENGITPSQSGDTSQAITWLPDGGRKTSSPGHGMRTLQLEVTRVTSNGTAGSSVPVSQPATPLATSTGLTPSSSFSPTSSGGPSALNLGTSASAAAAASAGPAPTGGSGISPSLLARRAGLVRQLSQDPAAAVVDSDPLSLDEEELELRGPIPLNAFDLINMVGGAAMGRMFVPRGGGGGSSEEKQVRTFTQFISTLPLEEIFAKLADVLKAMSDTQFRVHRRPCVVKASRSTARGKLVGACQLYQMTPHLFMLEWRKLKGDAFAFYDFFSEVKRRFTGQPDENEETDAYGDEPNPPLSASSAITRARNSSLRQHDMIANQRLT